MRKDSMDVSAPWDRRDIVLGVYAREEVPVEFRRNTRSDKVIGKVTVVHGGPFERGGLEGLEDFDAVSDEGRPFGDPMSPGIERALDQPFVNRYHANPSLCIQMHYVLTRVDICIPR